MSGWQDVNWFDTVKNKIRISFVDINVLLLNIIIFGIFFCLVWIVTVNKDGKITMNKFNVLEYNHAFLAGIGIFSFNPAHEFFKSIAVYYTLFLAGCVLIVSSIIFIFKNISQILFVLQGCSLIIGITL